MRILAVAAFAKALMEVATEVDDEDDPLDAIKEYGKELAKSLAIFGIAEASKVAKLARKAWRSQKVKVKPPPQPSFKVYARRYGEYRTAVPPPGAAPATLPLPTQPLSPFVRQTCVICGRTGHS